MTARYYPDCEASSPNGQFTLEARSPHNGTIPHRDGHQPSEDEFAFRYRSHQSNFRYRLLENPRVVWERWQVAGEDSPSELVVSDEGWSVIRTHGSRPEVIAVSPDGSDALRVRVAPRKGEQDTPDAAGSPPTFDWAPERLSFSTAGLYWAGHSWPYFFSHGGDPYFAWRASWGQRLVLDLGRAVAFPDESRVPPEVGEAATKVEKRGVAAFLSGLSGRMGEVREALSRRRQNAEERHPLLGKVWQASAALLLAGVHRVRECVPFLRDWEDIDFPVGSMSSHALPEGWHLELQLFRPVAHHALRRLGEEPQGLPTYHFTELRDNTRHRFSMPERVPDRRERAEELTRGMTAQEVLGLLGSPDFVAHRFEQVGTPHWTEVWEYDFPTANAWVTRRITWADSGGLPRMASLAEVLPYWLESDEREREYLRM